MAVCWNKVRSYFNMDSGNFHLSQGPEELELIKPFWEVTVKIYPVWPSRSDAPTYALPDSQL